MAVDWPVANAMDEEEEEEVVDKDDEVADAALVVALDAVHSVH